MKKLVIFSGAGISAESGIQTFRDSDGLWENYNIEEIATPSGWRKNREKVLQFYNQRFKQLSEVEPNLAHLVVADLETKYDVTVITQNVDNLHEKAGSTKVLHLHGDLTKMCSSLNKEKHITDIPEQGIMLGDKAPDGSQYRPYIVWFGEMVPNYGKAKDIVKEADILVIIGTSLNVYPVAGLPNLVNKKCIIYAIDPNPISVDNCTHIAKNATEGMSILFKELC